MADMSWRDAIVKVLEEERAEMHYADIAQLIIDRKFRESVGATPAASVAATLSTQLGGRVQRTKRGHYVLSDRDSSQEEDAPHGTSITAPLEDEVAEDAADMGLINAFGMFWRRAEVHWQANGTQLLGVQQSGSQEVDFSAQSGVYILYDGDRVVYVGRVTEPRLATRLREHTRDRLTGRWDRFSWFGVRAVDSGGKLMEAQSGDIDTRTLIATMEALLIEGLEPPQNRRQGDGFNAMEFIQQTDPRVDLARKRAVLVELGNGLS